GGDSPWFSPIPSPGSCLMLRYLSRLAIAITIPVTHPAKHTTSRRSLRRKGMRASPQPPRTAHPIDHSKCISRLAVRMYSRAEHCRRRGLEAQQQAARTTEKKIGDAFEDVAEGWFELAELWIG